MDTGVYIIKCLKTGYRYVGSGKSVSNRLSHHIATLKAGVHHSNLMQRHWIRYGAASFVLTVVAYCSKEESLTLEQMEIDKGGRLYNRQPLSVSAKGFKHTKSTKHLMSEAAKERNARPEYNKLLSERARLQHTKGKLGQATWSNAAKVAVREAQIARAPVQSIQAKALWNDPDMREKIKAARWTPERRAEQANRIRTLMIRNKQQEK